MHAASVTAAMLLLSFVVVMASILAFSQYKKGACKLDMYTEQTSVLQGIVEMQIYINKFIEIIDVV